VYRRITSRYPGRCAKCGDSIQAGDEIYWQRGSKAIYHVRCYGSEPAPTAPPITLSDDEKVNGRLESTFALSDVKDELRRVLDGNYSQFQNQESAGYRAYKLSDSDSIANPSRWHGYTKDEMLEWLKIGYRADAFQDIHEIAPPLRKRRKYIYADEGEMQIDLVLSGFDFPFRQWTKRENVPGLSIDVSMAFSAHVSESVIGAYQKWIARAVYTLETEGIDLDINVINTVTGIFPDDGGKPVVTRINVKRENEATDFANWSVMFSPGGFRGLMFLAKCMHARKRGTYALTGLGRPQGEAWDLKFNPDTRQITIVNHARASNFPADEMQEKLYAIVHNFKSL
jgi:hypothetical protein